MKRQLSLAPALLLALPVLALPVLALSVLAPSALAQSELQRIAPTAGVWGDTFGSSVALSGDRAIVGQAFNNGLDSGRVHFMERGAAGWSVVQSFDSPHPNTLDHFGESVVIEGDTAIATAPLHTDAFQHQGAAFVFEHGPNGWTFVEELLAADAAVSNHLGYEADLHGDVYVAGAFNCEIGGQNAAGAAYVFERGASGWTQTAKLTAPDFAASALFGDDVAVHGDTIVVGADGDGSDRGAVYVFEKGATGWSFVEKLVASDGAPGDWFGLGVALNERFLCVSAYQDPHPDGSVGSAYLFERGANGWSEVGKFAVPDAGETGQLGYEIVIDGDRALIGSWGPTPWAQDGSMHLLRMTSSGWQPATRLVPEGGVSGDNFGLALALEGSSALAGATYDDLGGLQLGAVYAYEIPEAALPYGTCAVSSICGNDSAWSGCANSTGFGARLHAEGSTSLAADDLVLEVNRLPIGTPAILFDGAAAALRPFGDGQLLVDGSSLFRRYATVSADTDGRASWGPNLLSSSSAVVGQTLWFQVWYADPAGPCGSGFNLSNGIAAEVRP